MPNGKEHGVSFQEKTLWAGKLLFSNDVKIELINLDEGQGHFTSWITLGRSHGIVH